MKLRVLGLILLVMPGVAAAQAWTCDLATACDGVFCADRGASVTLALDDAGMGSVSLSGTHADPDRMMSLSAKTRLLAATRVDWGGDLAVTFGDRETLGILAIGYSQRAYMSLHVNGADLDYAEQYIGFCKAVP